jgi:hypothetical protein
MSQRYYHLCTSMAARFQSAAHGSGELGVARDPELVLPQVGLCGGVHVDGQVRHEDPIRVRGWQ